MKNVLYSKTMTAKNSKYAGRDLKQLLEYNLYKYSLYPDTLF
jgi:hypothetical protein